MPQSIKTTGNENVQCGGFKIALGSLTFLSLRNGDVFPFCLDRSWPATALMDEVRVEVKLCQF